MEFSKRMIERKLQKRYNYGYRYTFFQYVEQLSNDDVFPQVLSGFNYVNTAKPNVFVTGLYVDDKCYGRRASITSPEFFIIKCCFKWTY
jgi:hypothetical protein